jgi:hypothetical protein
MDDEEEGMGLADAMMGRGAYLRQLRELAEADAREREQQAASEHQEGQRDVILTLDDGKSVLRYESYLSHQTYYDDLKHYDCNYIDFGGLLIQQEKAMGKGGLCWDAAFILAEHFISSGIGVSPDDTILELGAGTGLCGMLLSKSVSCHVEITDLPSLLPLMQRNVALNFGSVDDLSKNDRDILFGNETTPRIGTCEARVLEWGQQPTTQKTYRFILGADVVASLYDPVALANTIHQLSTTDTIVLISYKGRLDGPHERFEQRMQELFREVQSRISPLSRNKNPGVYILQAVGKRY